MDKGSSRRSVRVSELTSAAGSIREVIELVLSARRLPLS